MSNEIWWITVIALATFFVSLITLALLVWRGGRSRETAAVMASLKHIGEQVEETRRQNSTEHYQIVKMLRWAIDELARIVERFGFLSKKNAAEPPVTPRRPGKDDG